MLVQFVFEPVINQSNRCADPLTVAPVARSTAGNLHHGEARVSGAHFVLKKNDRRSLAEPSSGGSARGLHPPEHNVRLGFRLREHRCAALVRERQSRDDDESRLDTRRDKSPGGWEAPEPALLKERGAHCGRASNTGPIALRRRDSWL